MLNFVRLSRIIGDQTEIAVENAVIDDRDRRILGALSKNGRISYRELAKVANLSANATAERVERLQALGIIQGFGIRISPASLGLKLQAFIDVKLRQGTRMETFEEALQDIPGIREAASITGTFDARLYVDCADMEQLGRLIEQLRAQAGVQSTNSTVICRELRIGSK
jgi:Lrp/AsnC family transcriptional regulator, leucine-responsive regulatory protein